MIQIILSADIDQDIDIIPDLMKIEKQVYEPEYCGEYESIRARFLENKDTFVLAYDDTQMIGYLCFLPISEELYYEFIYSDIFHDDDILPKDIMHYYNGVNLYLLSIAILPQYQNTDVIIQMTNTFSKYLEKKAHNGIIIGNIVASAVTDDGEKFLQNLGFQVLKRVDSQFTLYHFNYCSNYNSDKQKFTEDKEVY